MNITEPNTATCPQCAGSTRMPLPEAARQYANVMAGYDAITDTLACNNCGGQTMSLTARGVTRIDPATGLGCMHQYVGRNAGRCLTDYTCSLCHATYSIDSGD